MSPAPRRKRRRTTAAPDEARPAAPPAAPVEPEPEQEVEISEAEIELPAEPEAIGAWPSAGAPAPAAAGEPAGAGADARGPTQPAHTAALERGRPRPHPAAAGRHLSVETLVYAAVVLFAAAWRLGNLGGYPLSAGEAREALAVWNALAPASEAGPASASPLLFAGNALLMGLFGSSDWSARLFVALCGVALVLVPLLYRRWLGRSGALAAGFLIALSPSAIAASRTLSPEMPAALFASLALGAALNWLVPAGRIPPERPVASTVPRTPAVARLMEEAPRPFSRLEEASEIVNAAGTRSGATELDRAVPVETPARAEQADEAGHWFGLAPSLALAALATGAALAAGQSVFTALLLFAVATLAWIGLSDAVRADLRDRLAAARAAGGLRSAAIVAVAAFALIATGFFMYPGGLGLAAGTVAAWLGSFVPGTTSGALGGMFNHLLILLIYEPMVLLLGLAGLVWQWRRASGAAGEDEEDGSVMRHWLAPVGVWLFAALLLSLVRPGRAPGEVLWIVLPLAGLGGALLGEAFDGRRAMQLPLLTWGLAAALLLIAVVAGVLVRTFATQTAAVQPGQEAALAFFPWMLALTVVIMCLLAAAVVVWDRPSWRAVALAVMVPLGVYACSAAYGVSNLRATSPAEPWTVEPTSERIYTFLGVLRDVSLEKTGTPTDVPITVQGSRDGLLGWYLRDYENVAYVDLLAPDTSTEVLITPAGVTSPTVALPYMGADFVLRNTWLATRASPVPEGTQASPGMQPGELLNWLLLRDGGTLQPDGGVVLWRIAPPEARPVEEPGEGAVPAGGEVIP